MADRSKDVIDTAGGCLKSFIKVVVVMSLMILAIGAVMNLF